MSQYKQLTQGERYQISAFCKAGYTQKEMAEELDRSKSSISRELRRNRGKRGYRPKQAHRKAMTRRHNANKATKMTPEVIKIIEGHIREEWSPEQITGFYRTRRVDMVSHERIYQHVWQDKREGGELYKHLRHGAKKYKKRYGSKERRGQLKGRVFIDERPDIVDEKERIGDMETDTIIGKNHKGAILTIVDRKSMRLEAKKLESKTARAVKDAAVELLAGYNEKIHTITSDNGKEFAAHKEISEELEADFYFAHPYHSWERGLNEHINGLLRQYFPKGTDFREITDEQLEKAVERINNRPRKTLNFKTPNEVFHGQLSSEVA